MLLIFLSLWISSDSKGTFRIPRALRILRIPMTSETNPTSMAPFVFFDNPRYSERDYDELARLYNSDRLSPGAIGDARNISLEAPKPPLDHDKSALESYGESCVDEYGDRTKTNWLRDVVYRRDSLRGCAICGFNAAGKLDAWALISANQAPQMVSLLPLKRSAAQDTLGLKTFKPLRPAPPPPPRAQGCSAGTDYYSCY